MAPQSDAVAPSPSPSPSQAQKAAYSTLKYLLSSREYAHLRKKAPKSIASKVATSEEFEAITGVKHGELNDFGTSAVRASLRVFLAGEAAFATLNLVMKLLGRKAEGNDR